MRVLIACEFSGVVRRAFRALGHSAVSCDLLPAEDDPPKGQHIQGDVLDVLRAARISYGDGWYPDLMIAHPPCTRLANSGVRWLHERNLWAELDEAAAFFRALLEAPIDKIAIENPRPHKYAVQRIGRRYDQAVQPWQFGHPETKETCFWLKNLPKLAPTSVVEGRTARVHREPPGPDRWKNRSRTYEGIAMAMAQQWGGITTKALRQERGDE